MRTCFRASRFLLLLVSLQLVAGCAPAPPTLTAVEPAGGPSGGGTEITLRGEGFKVGVEVLVGGRPAEVTSLDPSGASLTAVTPGGPPGDQQVVARHGADGKSSEALVFTYQPVRLVGTSPGGGSTVDWEERPESIEVRFDQPLDVSSAAFAVRPPADEDDGEDGGEDAAPEAGESESTAGDEDTAEPLEGVANYDEASGALTFTATKKLDEGLHRVAITGLQDKAGNTVEQVRFDFTVGPKPRVARRSSSSRSTSTSTSASGSGSRPGRTYDDGKLETFYFGRDLRFVDTRRVDYLWVADGFSFEGRSFHFMPWSDPVFIGEDAEKRDAEDWRLARQMTPEIPRAFVDILSHTWRGRAEVSTSSGDVKVTGRIVDCSTGNAAAKVLVGFGAGAGYTTFDMKFTDARSGRLVAALHHRVVSGTAWSTTDSKLVKWMERFGKQIAKRDFGGLYARGDVEDD